MFDVWIGPRSICRSLLGEPRSSADLSSKLSKRHRRLSSVYCGPAYIKAALALCMVVQSIVLYGNVSSGIAYGTGCFAHRQPVPFEGP